MSFIYQDGAVGIKADWFPFISKLFVGEKINPLQAFMQDFPIPGSFSAVDHADSLADRQFHGNVIEQQGLACPWKSIEPVITGVFCTDLFENLSFDVALLRSQEIFFPEKTGRFCQRRDQIKFCLKKILYISLIIRTFLMENCTQMLWSWFVSFTSRSWLLI